MPPPTIGLFYLCGISNPYGVSIQNWLKAYIAFGLFLDLRLVEAIVAPFSTVG